LIYDRSLTARQAGLTESAKVSTDRQVHTLTTRKMSEPRSHLKMQEIYQFLDHQVKVVHRPKTRTTLNSERRENDFKTIKESPSQG
jgi:hypothetical protein